jgi:hypothetical protein
MAHAYNPSYSGDRDQDDLSSKPETPSQKTLHKNKAGGVAQQGEGPEFKLQYQKTNKQKTVKEKSQKI